MNSPYQELKASSDEAKLEAIDITLELLAEFLTKLTFKSILNISLDDLSTAQQLLDRIRQLVMTRGDNEK